MPLLTRNIAELDFIRFMVLMSSLLASLARGPELVNTCFCHQLRDPINICWDINKRSVDNLETVH